MYEATCELCENTHKLNPSEKHNGKYVGQTARTLYERALEHVSALKNFDNDSFMWKHWALHHPDCNDSPNFWFQVIKCHKDPLTRLVHESVRIDSHASMNSRAEFNGYKVARIATEPSKKEAREKLDEMDKVDQGEADTMFALKTRVEKLTKTLNSNCRKRKARAMDRRGNELSPIVKKSKGDAKESVESEATKACDDMASNKSAVLRWLKAGSVKASTPVRSSSEGKSSSKPCEVNSDLSGESVEVANESLKQLEASEVGEVSQNVQEVESANPSSDHNLSEFDSTKSWFLTNVNSYCASIIEEDSENVMVEEKEVESIGSTTSSFMMIIDDYCEKTKPKLV